MPLSTQRTLTRQVSVVGHTVSQGERFTVHGRELPQGDRITLVKVGSKYFHFSYRRPADAEIVAEKLRGATGGVDCSLVATPGETTCVASI